MTNDGDSIKGTHRFRVTVDSQSLVSQVEFYVADKLVGTDESTPYEFVLDTLLYPDGPLAVTISAYNAGGENKKLTLNVRVNNGLSLGVAHHVAIAETAMTGRKWDEAIEAGRIALKINPSDNTARMAMARAYFGKGTYDLAQKFAEDVVASEPTNIAARELLSGISLRQAFRAMEVSSDRQRTISTVSSALKMAAKSRRDALQQRLDAFGAPNEANRLRYCDLLIDAGRFSLVIGQLEKEFDKDENNSDVTNRLVYAQLRAGRYSDAQKIMTRHTRRGEPDAYGYALKAVLDNWMGNDTASASAEREALLNDPTNIGVRTAQAYLALRRNNLGTFASITTGLAESEGSSPVTNYYLTSMYYLQAQFSNSQSAFESALLADPSMVHVYLERFNQSIAYMLATSPTGDDRKYQLDFARAFAEGALEAKPDSFEALTALSILAMFENKWDDAIRFGVAATQAGPEYGAAHYALAGAYFATQKNQEGTASMTDAAKCDKYLDGIRAPKTEEAWRYFYRYGRTLVLASPSRAAGN
jgi:tetratricopeptide (TPR) repeat protein